MGQDMVTFDNCMMITNWRYLPLLVFLLRRVLPENRLGGQYEEQLHQSEGKTDINVCVRVSRCKYIWWMCVYVHLSGSLCVYWVCLCALCLQVRECVQVLYIACICYYMCACAHVHAYISLCMNSLRHEKQSIIYAWLRAPLQTTVLQ